MDPHHFRHYAKKCLAYPKQAFQADWSWDLMRFTAVASFFTYSTYFLVRLYCLLEAEKADRRQLVLAWFFVALEFLSLGKPKALCQVSSLHFE
jgi:hypothetical protein